MGLDNPTPKSNMKFEELNKLIYDLAYWLGYKVWQRFPDARTVRVSFSLRLGDQSYLSVHIRMDGEYLDFNSLLLKEIEGYLPIPGLTHYTQLTNKNCSIDQPTAHQMMAAELEFQEWLDEQRKKKADQAAN